MSTIEANIITSATSGTDLTLSGTGSGVPNLEAGFKVAGTAGVPQASIQDQAINEAKLQVSNAPVNGYNLTAQSGNTGGLTWAAAAGGAWAVKASGTFNDSTFVVTAGFTDTTRITVSNMTIAASQDSYIGLRISTDGGSNFDSGSNYAACTFGSNSGVTSAAGGNQNTSSRNTMQVTDGHTTNAEIGTNSQIFFEVTIVQPQLARFTLMMTRYGFVAGDGSRSSSGAGTTVHKVAADVDAVQFYCAHGGDITGSYLVEELS
tara:strand:- start:822 stop:1607 length:786 start_codon:yes stop_codon:yes gene_type:complete